MVIYKFGFGLLLILSGCSHTPNVKNQNFPTRFQLDVTSDILETINGNTFVAHVRGLNPIFGRALTIKIREIKVESIEDKDSNKASLAFRQWYQFRRLIKESKSVEIRNIERGGEGFFVWADLYLDGKLLKNLK